MSFSVRRLTTDDVAAYRDIRLEGLRTETGFGRTFEEDAALPPEKWSGRLSSQGTFGVFLDGALVGIATIDREEGAKVDHRGHLYGVYVRPECRGTAAATMLMDAALAAAREQVDFLYLQVAQSNLRAVRFYERMGFTIYGRDPGGLNVGGTILADYLMMLRFDEGSGK